MVCIVIKTFNTNNKNAETIKYLLGSVDEHQATSVNQSISFIERIIPNLINKVVLIYIKTEPFNLENYLL